MKKYQSVVILLCAMYVLNACGGGTGGGGGQQAATHFSVSVPASTTAGASFSITVTALDASNNTVSNYAGTVHFASSDPHAALPKDSPLTNGTGTFSATFETIGNQTITATDTATNSITGTSGAVSVKGAVPSLSITSRTPPSGTVGVPYNRMSMHCTSGSPNCYCIYLPVLGRVCFRAVDGFALTAADGSPPYNWTATGLPPGLGLSGATISGTPPPGSEGTYNTVITVTDSAIPQAQASANYSITVLPPPAPQIITVPAPYSPTLNQPYTFSFTADGGALPLTWGVETGALPPGIAFSGAGVLSGKATSTGSFPIVVFVQDSANQRSPGINFDLQVFPHGFTPAGNMSTYRALQAAALLNDGRVLITGGADEMGDTAQTAEIYDPSSGMFTLTGNMNSPRSGHTATTLKSGNVLIIGGGSATAELFDPKTGSFTNTGSLPANCIESTATPLDDGTVLVAGGLCPNGDSAAAALYDPAAGTFTPVGNMVAARSGHTATLLEGGMVLITGGQGAQNQPLASAEVFDPSTKTFSPVGNMSVARYDHTATLLCDLSSGSCSNNKVLIAGGADNTAELFDPASKTFSMTGSMATARLGHTATLRNDGMVLLAGPDQSAELYDPTSGTFSVTGTMTIARQSHTATKLGDGTVLLTGGASVNADSTVVALSTAELYR